MCDGLPAIEERIVGTTFEGIANEFLKDYLNRLRNESERKSRRRMFELHVFPYLGKLDVFHVRPSDVLACIPSALVDVLPTSRSSHFSLPYTFCRPGEIRHAEWSEINFDKAEWRIPAEKMKMQRFVGYRMI